MTVQKFTEQVKALRKDYYKAIQTGVIPEGLPAAISALQAEEEQLLTAAVPLARHRVLQTRDPEASATTLVKNAKDLAEAPLTSEEKRLCQMLLRLDSPGEPEIPDVTEHNISDHPADTPVFANTDFKSSALKDGTGVRSSFNPEDYSGSPYMTVGNGNTCFLFLDDGSVILFENNNGWEYRKEPVLKNSFPENAIMESDHSCLILNLDHGIDRISYRRLETAEDLYHLPLFG